MKNHTKLWAATAPLALITSLAFAETAYADGTVECNVGPANRTTECGVDA